MLWSKNNCLTIMPLFSCFILVPGLLLLNLFALEHTRIFFFSHVLLFVTPWTVSRLVSLSFTVSQSCSNPCSLSQWCHPTILSSVVPFSSCLQSFPASGSFPMSQFFSSGGQSIGASASASGPSMIIQDWFPSGLTGLISLQSRWLSKVFSSTTVQKHQFFRAQPSLWSNSHPYMTTGKTIVLTIQTFVSKIMSLLVNMVSSFVMAFLPRSKCLLISWLQSPSAVILEPKKIISHDSGLCANNHTLSFALCLVSLDLVKLIRERKSQTLWHFSLSLIFQLKVFAWSAGH